MIDVIVPARDAQNLIIRLLSSLAIQIACPPFRVTIVNDGGGDYSSPASMFPMLDVKEISYGKAGMGPGYARQYGLDHTDGEVIVFCDADDFLDSATSLKRLSEPFSEPGVNAVFSPMRAYRDGEEGTVTNQVAIWLHGKAYRRSFIKEKGITFFPNSEGEDAGWNKQVLMNAGQRGVVMLPESTYVWTDLNKGKRLNTVRFAMFASKRGLVENMLHVVRNCRRNGIPDEVVKEEMVGFLLDLYVHYNLFLTAPELGVSAKDLDDFISWCRPIYDLVRDCPRMRDMTSLEAMVFEKMKLIYSMGWTYRGVRCSLGEFLGKVAN